jgi:methylglutaconyl-CoA hydratase
MSKAVRLTITGHRAMVVLDRPQAHNAFDRPLVHDLAEAVRAIRADPRVCVVEVSATGKAFSMGADPGWLNAAMTEGAERLRSDALAFATLLRDFSRLPQPTVGIVQGSAFGGGAGLLACCDVVVACERAQFAFPEVKLGLVAAMIAPYIVACMGVRQARRYLLTGEVFDAAMAARLGLVHETCPSSELLTRAETIALDVLENSLEAMASTKEALLGTVLLSDAQVAATVDRFIAAATSADGREGIASLQPRQRE